jgi:cell division protein FtsZ
VDNDAGSSAMALGFGGAGNDLLTHLMDLDPTVLPCVAVDTDLYALQIVKAHSKFLIQHEVGAGTRGDVKVGRMLGLRATPKLQSVLGANEIVFVLAGMGGGTGGGTAPVIAQSARKNGALVVGLVTKPFQFEQDRLHIAVDSVRRMITACDTVILIDNDVLEASSTTLPFGLSSDTVAQTCCSIIHSLTRTFAERNLCNAELGELRTMLRRGGFARASVGNSYSHLGAEEASLRALRNATVLGDLACANGVFVNVAGGSHVQRAHVESAISHFSRSIHPSAQLLYGHRVDQAMRNVTSVTLLATGMPFPVSWRRYRRLPLELYDLEAESAEEERLGLDLGLQQLESYVS